MTQALEVGIVVADLDRMVWFYTSALGCAEVRRSAVPASINGPAGLGGDTAVVWLRTPYGERIKLIRPDVPAIPSPPPEEITGRRGIGYITFYLDDAEPVLKNLRAAGAMVLSDPPLVEAHGRRIGFLADPEGNVVELVDGRGAK